MKNKISTGLNEVGAAVGVGLIAGLAGTLAITLSQNAEMKLTGRPPSKTPLKAVKKTLDLQAKNEEAKQKVSNEIHWVYGTSWGIGRGLLSLAGLKGWPATLAHFTMVWGSSLVMLPALELAPPITEQKKEVALMDAFHHAVYAVVAGLVFDLIDH